MNVPSWTRDEQSIDAAKSYLRQGGSVDFFEMIARSILVNHPNDPATFSLELVNNIIDGKEIHCEGEYHPQKMEDNQYMRSHNISEFLDEWVLALLRERPGSDAERMAFHKQYLTELKR